MADIKSRQTLKAEWSGAVQYGTVSLSTTSKYVAFAKSFSGTPAVQLTRRTGETAIHTVSRINPGSFATKSTGGTPSCWWMAIDGRTNL